MLILDCSVVRRLEPYFEPPSKAEDANSPVGPLQHHVAEPDFVEWENIDWAALSLGPDTPDGVYTPGTDSNNGSVWAGLSTTPNPIATGGPDEHLYDYGPSYGFQCLLPHSRLLAPIRRSADGC